MYSTSTILRVRVLEEQLAHLKWPIRRSLIKGQFTKMCGGGGTIRDNAIIPGL